MTASLGATQPPVYAGDHAALRIDNQGRAASVQVTGLENLDLLRSAKSLDLVVGMAEPGNDLFGMVSIEGELLAFADLVDLPATTQVQLDAEGGAATYQASGVLGRASVYAGDLITGPSAYVEVNDLPAAFAGSLVSTDPPVGFYNATAATGPVRMWFSPDPVTSVDESSDTYLAFELGSVPGFVAVSAAIEAGTLTYSAPTAIQNVRIATRGLWTGPAPDLTAVVSMAQAPAQLAIDASDGISLDASGGAAGPTYVSMTNVGDTPKIDGPHLAFHQREAAGTFRLSAQLPAVTSFQWRSSPSGLVLDADIDPPSSPFKLEADIRKPAPGGTSDEFEYWTSSLLWEIPASLQVAVEDDNYRVIGLDGLNADIDARIGWADAFAGKDPPEWFDGVSLRDYSCAAAPTCRPASLELCDSTECDGYWGRARIRGAPADLFIDTDAAYVQMLGFNASGLADSFEARVLLTETVDEIVNVALRQSGIPSPVDLRYGPISLATTESGVSGRLLTDHSADLGELDLAAQLPTGPSEPNRFIDLAASDTPAHADITVAWNEGMTVTATTSSPIAELVGAISDDPDGTAQGAGVFRDLPTSFSFTVNKMPEGDEELMTVPLFDYEANADTLDADVVVRAPIIDDPLREVRIGVTDLGRDASLLVDQTRPSLILDSEPATALVELHGQFAVVEKQIRVCIREELDIPKDNFPLARLQVEGRLPDDADDRTGIRVSELSGSAHVNIHNVETMEMAFGRDPDDGGGDGDDPPTGFELDCDLGDGDDDGGGSPSLAPGVRGEFDLFELWVGQSNRPGETPFVLETEFDVKAEVQKRPYWSWIPDWYETHLTNVGEEDQEFNHVVINALEDVRDSSGDPQTGFATCLNWYLGPVPAGFSLSVHTHPVPTGRNVDMIQLTPLDDPQRFRVISFLNPAEPDPENPGVYQTVIHPGLMDVVTANAGAVRPEMGHEKHLGHGC